jgi:hypothetical protein
MATDLIMSDPADGQLALAWKALSLLSSKTDHVIAELGDNAPAAIAAALAKTEHELRPVPDDGEGRAQWNAAMDERLRRLAVKVSPTASPTQTVEWRTMMVEALSDLPALVALTAAKKAIHRPFRYIGDIETAVREIAGELLAERETRRRGLERMRAENERARRPAPSLPAPVERDLSAEEIERTNAYLRRIGVRTQCSPDGEVFQLPADQAEAPDARAQLAA